MLYSILTVILPACSMGGTVNSKLGWNDNLAAIFEAKLTFNRPSVQSSSIVYLSALFLTEEVMLWFMS